MKTYRLKIIHDIVEDSYSQGELECVNQWQEDIEVKAISPLQAVKDYLLNTLLEVKDGDLCFDDDNVFCSTDILVNNDNDEAIESEIEKWKQGKIKLYNDHIIFRVFEQNEILSI
jgi:hypothetical protein